MKLLYKDAVFRLLLAGTAVMMIMMYYTGRPLTTPGTPAGILCLEFANTETAVDHTISSWKRAAGGTHEIVDAAKLNTYLDFIFLFFYSLLLYSFCLRLAKSLGKRKNVARYFRILAALSLTAGLLDVMENAGMLTSLNEAGSDEVAMFTAIAATIKWSLVILIILSLATGLIYRKQLYREG
jgi:hypothetical protein